MKIAEIFHNLIEKDADRLRELEADIKAGKRPSINNAGWTSRGYSWSDLIDLGFAKKDYEIGNHNDPEDHKVVFHYTGPEPVTLHTRGSEPKVIEPGYVTN